MPLESKPVLPAFFGHHKAATTWISLILNDVAAALRLRVLTIHSSAAWSEHACLGDLVRSVNPDLLLLTNARQADVDTLPEFRGFHVIRDPRDMIVSGYFSHLYSHSEEGWPELPPHRRALQRLNRDDGLHAEIRFSARFIDHMSTWNYHQSGVLELRMEDLVTSPHLWWRAILLHLDLEASSCGRTEWLRSAFVAWNVARVRGLPSGVTTLRRVLPRWPLRRLPASYLTEALAAHSFTRLAGGRSPGEEDPTHHYRRGVPGDWRNHLNAQHLASFRARYGDLVERLGYEW